VTASAAYFNLSPGCGLSGSWAPLSPPGYVRNLANYIGGLESEKRRATGGGQLGDAGN